MLWQLMKGQWLVLKCRLCIHLKTSIYQCCFSTSVSYQVWRLKHFHTLPNVLVITQKVKSSRWTSNSLMENVTNSQSVSILVVFMHLTGGPIELCFWIFDFIHSLNRVLKTKFHQICIAITLMIKSKTGCLPFYVLMFKVEVINHVVCLSNSIYRPQDGFCGAIGSYLHYTSVPKVYRFIKI